MTQYIDKSVLLTEMIRKMNRCKKILLDIRTRQNKDYYQGKREAYIDILSFINTLEVKIEPVSNDLEEAAKKAGQKYFPDESNIWARPNYEAIAAANAFKEGAKWQEEQCQKTIELAEDHAYLAGQEKMIDKACEWLKESKDHPFIKCEDPCLSGYLTDEFIEEFKKAMK